MGMYPSVVFHHALSKIICPIITTVIVSISFYRTAFTDTWLLNGFLFSFVSINLLVWFVQ